MYMFGGGGGQRGGGGAAASRERVGVYRRRGTGPLHS